MGAMFFLAIAGLVVTALGVPLQAAGTRRPTTVLWGKRLFFGGLALMYLGFSLALVVGVATGKVLWPALISLIVTLPLAIGIGYGLRRFWNDPH